ncbi:MAG: hypothetical protein ABWZ80_03295 [Beijerinckiaceae bacterium]
MSMTLRAAAAGFVLAALFKFVGKPFEASVILLAVVAAGLVLDLAVKNDRRKVGPNAASFRIR